MLLSFVSGLVTASPSMHSGQLSEAQAAAFKKYTHDKGLTLVDLPLRCSHTACL